MSSTIEACAAAGIRLWAEGNTLRYDAPKGALTPELIAELAAHKAELLTALAHPDPLPPLSPEVASRRQKVLNMLTRNGGQYAVYVEDAESDPVIMAVAIRDKGTCEVQIPRDRYDPFKVLELVKGWEREDIEPDPLWWRASIQEPDGRTVEIDAARGMSLPDWESYASCYHGPGCAVTPLLPLPKPDEAPVNPDEALRAASEGLESITAAEFWGLLSPEDVADIEAGGIAAETLRAFALSFARRGSARSSRGQSEETATHVEPRAEG